MVSKLGKEKILVKLVSGYEETKIENLKLKRLKFFNKLEWKIWKSCMIFSKNYEEIAEETGEVYDYVKKVMDKMAERGELTPQPAIRNDKPTNIFKSVLTKEVLEDFEVKKFPFTAKNGTQITEAMFRSELYKKMAKFEKRSQ